MTEDATPAGETPGISRRTILRHGAVAGSIVWAAPLITSTKAGALAEGSPPPGTTTPTTNGTTATLTVGKSAPPSVFTDQEFDFTITVQNTGSATAQNVVLVDTLPSEGSFVSSDPSGVPSGGTLTLDLGDIGPGDSVIVKVRWKAPGNETTLTNSAAASATNASSATGAADVAVGSSTVITGAGVTAAGTALRNRDNGTITISGLPAGATVTRAVLTWAILYNGAVPANTITFEGTVVSADLTATTSGNLCWGDSATIGYAADVTSLVSGNGTYSVTDPVNGMTNDTSDPNPVLPVTDGASLVVFFDAPGVDNQVFSDFSYSTNTAATLTRSFSGINSVGGPATLWLAGPDGQTPAEEPITVTANGSLDFSGTLDGSDPNTGPDLSIGNLWDTDAHDVSSILPAGQTTLSVSIPLIGDCVGVNAAVLSVSQTP